MADNEQPKNNAAEESPLTAAAKTIGHVVGQVAHAVGAGGAAEAEKPKGKGRGAAKTSAKAPETKAAEQPADLYKAEYHGSGTFVIKKPKRSRTKLHQNRAKSPQRGARK